LIAQFSRFPDDEAKSHVTMLEGDFVTEMDRLRLRDSGSTW
jgi:hypothetical protein